MSSWVDSVLMTSDWYSHNVNTYSQSKTYKCSLENAGDVRADCSGFVSCCLRVAGVLPFGANYGSSSFATTTGKCAELLKASGFVPMKYSFDIVQPFDIIALNGHVEIFCKKYGNSGLSYAWGNNHNVSRGGLPCWMTKKKYVTIWRRIGEQDEIDAKTTVLSSVAPIETEENEKENKEDGKQ